MLGCDFTITFPTFYFFVKIKRNPQAPIFHNQSLGGAYNA